MVKINGSYGTSFRAPRRDILATIPSVSTVTYNDVLSPAGCSYVLVVSGVNPDIKSETADTWSLGAEINPIVAPSVSLQINYFNIKFRNQLHGQQDPKSCSTTPRLLIW